VGVVLAPGLGNESGDYDALVERLSAKGASVAVAEVARVDWLRNAAGLADIAYWRGTLSPMPTVSWYLERMEAAVAKAKAESGAEKVVLLGHSAGGWLSRVFLHENGAADVSRVVTLGSPLRPAPTDVPGVIDQTRGIATWIEENCDAPGSSPPFVCVASKYIRGADSPGDGFSNFLIGQGYKQVCGEANVWGDGITPLSHAHLDGALNITLDGVYHSPLGAAEGRLWYGDDGIFDQWSEHVLTP